MDEKQMPVQQRNNTFSVTPQNQKVNFTIEWEVFLREIIHPIRAIYKFL